MSFLGWMRGRKKIATVTAFAVVVATPVTLAILHQGFPISDVDLMARDVWVTNGSSLLTGRLNMQIQELNGGVTMASRSFDVMQDGQDVFVYDEVGASVERVDPAYVSLSQTIIVPQGAEVTYGGQTMTILRPSDGALWVVRADSELQFDPEATEPTLTLGENAHAAATLLGSVVAVSAEKGEIYRIDGLGAAPEVIADVSVDDYSLSAVGERAVILDRTKNELILDDGTAVDLPETGLRIQQVGPERDFAVVASGASILKVAFTGSVEQFDGDVATPALNPEQVAAPVVLANCIHGAWASGARYLGICDDREPSIQDIPKTASDSELEFRVNKNVIALNNVTDGNVWLVTESMRLVQNWDEVTPPQLDDGEEGDEKVSVQTFEDTLAERTDQNTVPIARPDEFGVRPGKTTILRVLDNDTDPDGDVLTILSVSDVSEAAGVVQFIDGGRSLQFVPAANASGTVSFRYSVSDGRPGGVAEAQVDVAIRPLEENLPPVAVRSSGVTVEAGQTVTYNVLADWRDPDGDDLLVIGAAPDTADVVRFRPDGEITFTNISSELGQKKVVVTFSDGRETAQGELLVDVKASGELNPVGTPDFTTSFANDSVEIEPLSNDRSPSGASLSLLSVESLGEGLTFTVNLDRGTVSAVASSPGSYYLEYALGAGAKSSIGLIRVDISEDPSKPLPPIAVKDTAYIRPNEPTLVPALANDQSPGGRVIGIQSITLPAAAEQLSVEILRSTVLRITAPSGMTSAIEFTYTISDGVNTSTAGVTVVPVPELTKHQAPIAADDSIKVRVGDIASVSVLANDYHPDGARMRLDTVLGQNTIGTDGVVFVTGDRVRVQAPSEPGQYVVTYRIFDAFDESAVANVVMSVLAAETKNNAQPQPRPLTARVFQGASVTIEVPLDGIDPDGDSVVLVSAVGATLGEVTGQSSTAFTYSAFEDAAGTDTFAYEVRDASGTAATGEIRIGVLPRPDTVLRPSAVNDSISIRPGRTASVPVLANDSDPNGYPIQIAPKLMEVQAGISAEVDNEAVVVTAGDGEATYVLRYAITNGKGGTDDAFVTVTVDKNAPPAYPVAIDHVVEVKDIVGKKTVDVNVLDSAQNPGGLVGDLAVTLEGANAPSAEVLPAGMVRVTLGETRQAVAYKLTNIDDLQAMAFVIVPAYTSDLPPVLKPELIKAPPAVSLNQSKEWKLSEILNVPSGRQARLINPETATGGRSNGDPIAVDDVTLRYTPEKDFRGTVQLTFQVTDGTSVSDPSGSQATIAMAVIVGDANFEDMAPTFSDGAISVEAGEPATVVDLRDASSHPNPAILSQLTYAELSGATSDVSASLSGSSLSVAAPFGVQPGVTVTIGFTVNYKDFSVPGQMAVKVVASTRPLPQAVDDVEPEGRASSTYTLAPLSNDFNPFAADGTPLKIVSAAFEGENLGATLSSTTSTVTVSTSTTKSGTISVIYRVRDVTDTAAREVQGRITVVVASAPEPVTAFVLSSGPQTVGVQFDPPSSSNGAEITGYVVTISGSPGTASQPCAPTSPCQFSGRTNGQSQTVTIAATNKVGTTVSGSQSITPWGVPSAPTGQDLTTDSATAMANIVPQWSSPTDTGGGQITYDWNYTQGASGGGSTGGLSGSGALVGQGDYAFEVRACNPGGCSAYVGASRHINAPPPPPRTATVSDGGVESGAYHWLRLNVSNFPAGTYTVKCYADGTNGGSTAYDSQVVALPSNGSVVTSCHAKSDGYAGEWLMIEIVGIMYTPHYTPWT